MKKLLAVLLATVMTMSLLTACGGSDDPIPAEERQLDTAAADVHP